MTKAKAKPLSRLRDKAKGKIHHIEIHPAKNSRGGQAYITKTYRHPAGEDKPGQYRPMPEPEETPHEDGEDMIDHVRRSYGVKPEMDDEEEGDEEE